MTMVATADVNSSFTGWNGCDNVIGNNCEVANWLSGGSIVPFGNQTVVPAPPLLTVSPNLFIYNTDDVVRTSWNQPSGATFFRMLIGGSVRDDYTSFGVSPGHEVNDTGGVDRVGNFFYAGTGKFIEVRACNAVGCSGPSNRLTFDVIGIDTPGFERKVTASFNTTVIEAPTTFSLTVVRGGSGTVISVPAGIIDCGTTCSVSNLTSGSQVTLTASPALGFRLAGWDGCNSTNNNDCIVNITNSSRVVGATFSSVPPQVGSHSLIVKKEGLGTGVVTSAPAGISCGSGAGCIVSFAQGSNITLTASPDSGSSFAGCINSDSVNFINNTCVISNLSAPRIVTVIFSDSPPQVGSHSLTVKKEGLGTGVVTSAPAGISCGSGAGCIVSFAQGSNITLTASPDSGSSFAGCINSDSVNFINNTCVISNLSAPRIVKVLFSNIPIQPGFYNLMVDVQGPGVVT